MEFKNKMAFANSCTHRPISRLYFFTFNESDEVRPRSLSFDWALIYFNREAIASNRRFWFKNLHNVIIRLDGFGALHLVNTSIIFSSTNGFGALHLYRLERLNDFVKNQFLKFFNDNKWNWKSKLDKLKSNSTMLKMFFNFNYPF